MVAKDVQNAVHGDSQLVHRFQQSDPNLLYCLQLGVSPTILASHKSLNPTGVVTLGRLQGDHEGVTIVIVCWRGTPLIGQCHQFVDLSIEVRWDLLMLTVHKRREELTYFETLRLIGKAASTPRRAFFGHTANLRLVNETLGATKAASTGQLYAARRAGGNLRVGVHGDGFEKRIVRQKGVSNVDVGKA